MLEQVEKGINSVQRTFKVKIKQDSNPLIFSSMFDQGNMQKLQFGPNGSIILTPGNDCSGTAYEGYAKGWFHFMIKGGQNHAKIKLIIKKLTQLSSQSKISQYFKPVFRYQKQQWSRIQNSRTITKEDDTQLHIEFQFTKSTTVYFAYTFPFGYEECQKYLERLQHQAKKMKSIYYCDQLLIKSPQGRNIHLVTLSSIDQLTEDIEDIQNGYLFPEKKRHAMKFSQQSQKRVVIISARVHPAQAPSSHTFNGLIKFLLSKYLIYQTRDARAYYLRRNFIFKLIPMLNPDGVSNGYYRMDVFNQNLNRFYQNPDPLLQPSAYAVKEIGKYYSQQGKLCFYIDLHAHPQKKGNFIYGNAMQTTQLQAQTQLFAKILSLNSIQFDYINSSFDSKHMTLKDKNEDLTKQGCGRVVFQKQFNLQYSYTMECGYTCSNYLNEIQPIDKGHRKFEYKFCLLSFSKHSVIVDELDNIKNPYYSGAKKSVYFTIQAYETLGKNIAVSILDLFGLNPASRIPNTPYQNLDGIRKEITAQLQNGSSSYCGRKYVGKPHSQQMIQSLNTHQKKVTKTINSFTSIQQKPLVETVSVEKKVVLLSSQFIFLQRKTLSEKMRQKKSQKDESSPVNEKKLRSSTLPKVNLFKLNSMKKNMKFLTNF